MAWVYNHRKMGQLAQNRNTLQIQRIAGVGFKGADSPLAENYILISGSHDIFSGHHPLFVSGVEASL